MAPSSSSSSTATSVQVALRIRPPTNQDSTSIPARFQRSVIQATSSTSIAIEAVSASLANAGAPSVSSGPGAAKKQAFTFDQVHGPPTTQYEMFESTAKPLISRFLEGFNCTILAYGQTSSGKTFTMTGVDLDADPTDPSTGMGIVPRAVSNIFMRANQLKEEKHGMWTYNIKASFIEIYNEDLIDLLSLDEGGGARREVQIREDKDGHIIWGGLREVNVRNASEVMGLIRKGTSIRRTNETDMNAQSSRSHAIFSLTLTQKKYTGSGPPPRSSSPLPPGGRSPSRLARPGSMYAGPGGARVSSPTNGRPSTPSFASAMHRGGGLRPASALGHSGDRPAEDDSGEWVSITSKFHFVDLAGSERLKRTAAQGERIKEGISINSGLLALGNVISALGDPARAKSHTASYVPYRDSKLTRLLQDSLGGNAHTLMIACVSPAEWNAAETVNTLKYANRARNIKNRAVVNEKEEGWDDVEWLQGTVSRLRKELKVLKEGGALPGADKEVEVVEGASKKVLGQLSELQNNYEDLREKFVERTEELTRLRGELGEKHRQSTGGTVGGTAKYEEIVGPVIEEYEKTISAMEAELSLNRAALRHTNELVEEKEEELSAIHERHSATEMYVEELRNRVAKLSEREASNEAYIRDLEEKMKAYDETSMSSSESMHDLKKEVARYRESEGHSSKYIADLEARLAKSDESILALQQSVENLEQECERRQNEVESLQGRLETFRQDGEGWLTNLEEREKKVKALEEKMAEWEKKKEEANEARARLGEVVDEVVSARRSLQLDLAKLPAQPIVTAPSPISESPPSEPLTPSPAPDLDSNSLESQLLSLQQTHTATLADLSSVTAKYRDALREISDLAAQIQEAKLINSTPAESIVSESPSPVNEKPAENPPSRRRMTGGRSREASDSQLNTPGGRRLFFRQAASTESLHARSLSQSQSLSQELSLAHSRKASFSSHGTSSSHSHSPSNSLSAYNSMTHRPNLSISLPSLSPTLQGNERSVSSLEKEIMRLQEVLKDREAEISSLETSLKESEQARAPQTPTMESKAMAVNGVNGHVVNGIEDVLLNATLSPRTLNQFDHIRKTMEGNGHAVHPEDSSVASEDDSLERLNELMLSMAQKESQHREIVDDLNSQLGQTRRQLDELTTLSRDQALNMSHELEALRGKHEEDIMALEDVRKRETDLLKAIEEAKATHADEIEQLRLSHSAELEAKGLELESAVATLKAENEALVASIKAEHDTVVSGMRAENESLLASADSEREAKVGQLVQELESATTALEKARGEHESAFGALKTDHEKQLNRQIEEANAMLTQTRQDHEKAIAKIQAEHAIALRQKDEEAAASQHTTEEEYYNALTKLRVDHAESIKTINAENAAAIERLREEHAHELKTADTAREGSLSASETSQNLAIQELQEQHAAAIARKDTSFAEQVDALKAGHARELTAKDGEHGTQLDRLRLEHDTAITKLKVEWRNEVERLGAEKEAGKEEHAATVSQLKKEHDDAIQMYREQQASVLQELERGHEDVVSKLKVDHSRALEEAARKLETELSSISQLHAAEMDELRSVHTKELAQLRSTHVGEMDSLQSIHTEELEQLRSAHTAEFDQLRSSNAKEVADLSSRLANSENAVAMHSRQLAEVAPKLEAAEGARDQHAAEVSRLASQVALAEQSSVQHRSEIDDLLSHLASTEERHRQELDHARLESSGSQEETGRLKLELEELRRQRLADQEAYQEEREDLSQELETQKAAAYELESRQRQALEMHESEIVTKDDMISTMQEQLSNVSNERDDLEAEVSKLRAELAQTRGEQSRLIQEASKRESLVGELERHRSVLAELQESLQKVKDEKDVLQVEKLKSDTTIRELQAQIARSASPPNARSPDRIGFPRGALPAIKLPPPTPPPTVPPPPAPRSYVNGDSNVSTSSHGSSNFMSSNASYRDSQPESPSTSVGPLSPAGVNGFPPIVDTKMASKVEEQAKHIEEQEAMIKTLNKQLTHCETDLQTHMDIVSKLESSLGDAEKNLRKSRMQATELARERDSLNIKIDQMRNELTEAQREVVIVRRSVAEEKETLEQRLDEERKARERARQQLDARTEEFQRRKSKFACL